MQTLWLGTIHNYALEYKFFYSSTHYIHRTSYGHPYDVQWISIWISIGCPLDNLWMWIWIGRGLDVWISYGYPMDVRRRLGCVFLSISCGCCRCQFRKAIVEEGVMFPLAPIADQAIFLFTCAIHV